MAWSSANASSLSCSWIGSFYFRASSTTKTRPASPGFFPPQAWTGCAGAGAWHDGAPLPGAHLRGLQLWIALPAALEHAPAESQYVDPRSVPQECPETALSFEGPVEFVLAAGEAEIRRIGERLNVAGRQPTKLSAWARVNFPAQARPAERA